jgi:homoserine O-succinyltransferase/O-acetyltransferase
MPIKLPASLPAFQVLTDEGVMVMSETRARHQDIRPLRIGLLNLMPKKIQTETQFARLIGATPIQIDLQLIRMTDHRSRNTASEHMEAFYRPFAEIAASGERLDGLIVTGAPIEHLDFEEVTYWPELREVFDWAETHVHATMGVCWGGMAMAYHRNGVAKHALPAKAFGLFSHENLAPASPLLRGFSDEVDVPVSRWTEMRRDELEVAGLQVLLSSEEVGPCLVADEARNTTYIFNHLEYDSDTLQQEYERDVAAGKPIDVPHGYFPGDDPARRPRNRWRSHAHLLYGNWVNEIYQTVPYEFAATS